jgi:hypothetical protein
MAMPLQVASARRLYVCQPSVTVILVLAASPLCFGGTL